MDPEQLKKLQEKEEALGDKIQKLLKKIGGKKPTKAQSDKLAALQGRLDRVGDTKQKALTAVIAADEDEAADVASDDPPKATVFPLNENKTPELTTLEVDPRFSKVEAFPEDAEDVNYSGQFNTPKDPALLREEKLTGFKERQQAAEAKLAEITARRDADRDRKNKDAAEKAELARKGIAAIGDAFQKRKARIDFGQAMQTGLENLSGDALKANMSGLREAMVSQGLVSAEQFNRTGRRMMKNLEAQRFKDSLTDPARSAVTKTPGLDRQEAMQGRAFGTSTALEGSVGGLGDANRSLESEKGRLNRAARALERAGNKKEAGEARAAAEAMGRPGIRTQAARAAEKAAREQQEKLEEEKRKQIAAMVQEGKDRSQKTVNKNATPGAGRGTRI